MNCEGGGGMGSVKHCFPLSRILFVLFRDLKKDSLSLPSLICTIRSSRISENQ